MKISWSKMSIIYSQNFIQHLELSKNDFGRKIFRFNTTCCSNSIWEYALQVDNLVRQMSGPLLWWGFPPLVSQSGFHTEKSWTSSMVLLDSKSGFTIISSLRKMKGLLYNLKYWQGILNPWIILRPRHFVWFFDFLGMHIQ